MAMTKSDILTRVSAHAKGTATAPTGSELSQWSEFLEQANQEWTNTYDPQVMIKQYRSTMLQSGTSLALPADFKEKFAGYINIEGSLYPEFDPVEAVMTSGSFVEWGGNQTDGYYLKTQARYSTSAVIIPYHSRPTSLSTLTSVSPIPDPEFLVTRVTEYVMFQQGRGEYVEFQQKADLILSRLVANEVSADIQKNKTIRTATEYTGFQIGED